MERREFIKQFGMDFATTPIEESKTLTLKKKAQGAATVAVASFDRKKPYGNSLALHPRAEGTVSRATVAVLEDARKNLPSGTKFYVLDGGEKNIWHEGKPTKVDLIAWFYSPTPLQAPLTYRVIAEVTA